MNTQEQKESDLIDTICKCRRGSMDDKQFRATVEHALSQAIRDTKDYKDLTVRLVSIVSSVLSSKESNQ